MKPPITNHRFVCADSVVRMHPGSVNFAFKLPRDAERQVTPPPAADPHVNTRNWVRVCVASLVGVCVMWWVRLLVCACV